MIGSRKGVKNFKYIQYCFKLNLFLGRPAANRYIWRRGGHRVNYVDSYNWTISPVTLETEANISCVAVNQVGQGEPDFITIEVFGELFQ